jgi:hypothetical protein
MKITKKFAAAAAAGAIVLGGGSMAFAAGTGSSGTNAGTPTGARAAFVCANLPALQAQQAAHVDLVNGRIALLQKALAAAPDKPKLDAKIQKRIDKANDEIKKIGGRETKLTNWAGTHCDTATPTTPAA